MRPSQRRACLLAARAIAGLAVCVPCGSAVAQNTDSFFFSDDAALMAGAVVGRPAEAAAAYYNPAALGALERPRVVVNGSVFGVRFRENPDAFVTEVADGANHLSLDSTTYVATPTGVTASFALFPWLKIAGGFYTTDREIEDAADDAVTETVLNGTPTRFTQRIHYQLDRKKMVAGGAFGIEVTDTFRIGSALFGTYTTNNVKAEFSNDASKGTPLSDALVFDIEGEVSAIALLTSIGAQWDLSDRVHLGLNVFLPELLLTSSSESRASTVTVGTLEDGTPVGGVDYQAAEADGDPEALAPPRISLGVNFELSPAVELGVGVDAITGIRTETFQLDRKGVVNVRAGVRWQVIPELALGGGLFTDLAADAALGPGLGARRLDFFGATLGGSLMTPLEIIERPDGEPVIIATTVAVRYALGFGEARSILVEGNTVRNDAVDVLGHDLMPYLGTSISL